MSNKPLVLDSVAPGARVKKPVVKPKPVKSVVTTDHTKHYAMGGVGLMAVLSAGLNGYANAQQATVVWAGWTMGIVIPIIVLVLAKVAGGQYNRGHLKRAACTASAGLGLLLLSVFHCSQSIALLTGGSLWLAAPMAIAIDAGLVACEVATLD